MTGLPESGLYRGTVVHRRLRPVRHALRYRVFSILFDCDRLDQLDKGLRFFSRNRFNLFSLHDSDHGDGTSLEGYLARVAAEAGMGETVERFLMLCYPRVLGYVFNPLTVYYGLDAAGRTRLVVYEVNNTFGERKSYVLPCDEDADSRVIAQSCRKRLYVSPFNDVSGQYSFHLTPPGEDDLTVGVALRTAEGPLLNAYFHGLKRPLSDAELLKALASNGLMTVKVMAGIHWEALKLWLKGVKLVPRPPRPDTPVSFVSRPREEV